jgi:hypothetical protein
MAIIDSYASGIPRRNGAWKPSGGGHIDGVWPPELLSMSTLAEERMSNTAKAQPSAFKRKILLMVRLILCQCCSMFKGSNPVDAPSSPLSKNLCGVDECVTIEGINTLRRLEKESVTRCSLETLLADENVSRDFFEGYTFIYDT